MVSSSSSPQSQSENETVKESKHPKKLPDSVTVLECPDGGKVYLVGTAHFSEKSCKDVEEVIARVKPNVIVLELCKNRMHILEYDEKSLLKEIENLSFSKLAATIRQVIYSIRNCFLNVNTTFFYVLEWTYPRPINYVLFINDRSNDQKIGNVSRRRI